MKKKLIAVLFSVFVVVGIVACGAETEGGTGQGNKNIGKECTVILEGNKYDLSGDFQQVVGKMVKDGNVVVHNNYNCIYNEEGKYDRGYNSNEDGEVQCWASENAERVPVLEKTESGFCPVISARYILGMGDAVYETAQGIKHNDGATKVKELENYVSVQGIRQVKDETYAAIYLDGQIVNLDEYEDEYNAWYEDAKKTSIAEACEKILPHYMAYPFTGKILTRFFDTNKDVEDLANGGYAYFKEEMLINLVAMEAIGLLEDGKIDSYDIIFYEDMGGNDMDTYIYHFFYDTEWDSEKFRQKK